MNIFHAYDVRGLYETQITIDVAYAIGCAFAKSHNPKTCVVGYDARHGSVELANAVIDGLSDSGVTVYFVGFVSTPMVWFGVNHFSADSGIMVTASHNPKEYNGFKFCGKGAKPIGMGSGLEQIQADFDILVADTIKPASQKNGTIKEVDVYDAYLDYITKYIPLSAPGKIIVDCSSGVMGEIVERVFARLDTDVFVLNEKPDGDFSAHPPNPLLDEAIEQTQDMVRLQGADFGVIFDGDGDRLVLIDETGSRVSSDVVFALLCEQVGMENKSFVTDLRFSHIILDHIKNQGGTTHMTRVGRPFIVESLLSNNAVLAGEISGHFYYKDFFGVDNGIITLLLLLQYITSREETVSQLCEPYLQSFQTGEVNVKVSDTNVILSKIKESYSHAKHILEMDGLSVYFDDFWFNVRPSNTEPLLRINMEADSSEILREQKEKLFSLIQSN